MKRMSRMVEWKKDVVHTCYGCEMYCPVTHAEKSKSPSGKRCGGNHYECDYFCNGGKPNVGVYAKKEEEQE